MPGFAENALQGLSYQEEVVGDNRELRIKLAEEFPTGTWS
jgi:hypothetical protein